jgi:hypothetical protein
VKKLIQELKYVTKANGKLSLTDEGKKYMVKNSKGVASKPRDNKGLEEFFKEKIRKNTKVPASKLDLIWGLLGDRKEQGATVQDLLKVSGYERADSTGYREIMKELKKYKLVVKEKSIFMFDTSKVFPYDE